MQKDLFGATASILPGQGSKSDFLERYRLSLRLDQTLVALIFLLVVYVLVFSFGVETGKRYAMAELKAERAKREVMAQEFREKVFANIAQGKMVINKSDLKTDQIQIVDSAATEPSLVPSTTATSEASRTAEVGSAEDPTVIEAAVKTDAATSKKTTVEAPQSAAGKFTIQMVTHTSKTLAEQEIKRLSAKGFKGFIVPKGKYHIVCVNGFDTRNKAGAILKQLKTQGVVPPDAYVRSIA
jgi:cell division septation protein DedD